MKIHSVRIDDSCLHALTRAVKKTVDTYINILSKQKKGKKTFVQTFCCRRDMYMTRKREKNVDFIEGEILFDIFYFK